MKAPSSINILAFLSVKSLAIIPISFVYIMSVHYCAYPVLCKLHNLNSTFFIVVMQSKMLLIRKQRG